jgi:hypothetical protein
MDMEKTVMRLQIKAESLIMAFKGLHSRLSKNEGFLIVSSMLTGMAFGLMMVHIGNVYGDGSTILILLGIAIFYLSIIAPVLKSHLLMFLLWTLIFSFVLIANLLTPNPIGSLKLTTAILTLILSLLAMGFSYTYADLLAQRRARKKQRKKSKN